MRKRYSRYLAKRKRWFKLFFLFWKTKSYTFYLKRSDIENQLKTFSRLKKDTWKREYFTVYLKSPN